METIKQNIHNALVFFDFDDAKKIYEQNVLKYDKLKLDYILFLLNIGELDSVDKFFDINNLNFGASILDGKFQIEINELRLEIKEILNSKNVITDISHLKYKNYYVNYILKQCINNSSLTSDFAIVLFEKYIIRHNSLITKGCFISNALKYFHNNSDSSFVQRLKFNLTSFMENHFYELPI
ncbi:hypothetical protein ACWU02_001193 [Campylobacter coli]